jgi:preprotein translocase subunit SecB
MTLEYYKLIRNNVQLRDVELLSLECHKNDGEDKDIVLELSRAVNIIKSDEAEIQLQAKVRFVNEGPFEFDMVYKGVCFTLNELKEEDFKEYAYEQVVPLLLPYARECIASTMARMGLSIYTIPTMDILASLELNREENR